MQAYFCPKLRRGSRSMLPSQIEVKMVFLLNCLLPPLTPDSTVIIKNNHVRNTELRKYPISSTGLTKPF